MDGGAGKRAVHPAIEPLSYLLGTWRGQGEGGFSTISSFTYGEELNFTHPGNKGFDNEMKEYGVKSNKDGAKSGRSCMIVHLKFPGAGSFSRPIKGFKPIYELGLFVCSDFIRTNTHRETSDACQFQIGIRDSSLRTSAEKRKLLSGAGNGVWKNKDAHFFEFQQTLQLDNPMILLLCC